MTDNGKCPDDVIDIPEVFTVTKLPQGWQFGRRKFISLAGAAAASAALACGTTREPDVVVVATDPSPPTNTPRPTTPSEPTALPEPTSLPLSPEEEEAARRETCLEIVAHDSEISRIESSPDGKMLATTAFDFHEQKLWSLPGGSHYLTFSSEEKIWFNPAGGQYFIYFDAMEVIGFDTETGEELMSFEGEPLIRYREAFSPDGSLIILKYADNLLIYSTADGELIADFMLNHVPTAALITADNNKVVMGDETGAIIVFDLLEGTELSSWQAMDDVIRSLQLAEEESILVVVGQESAAFSYWSFPEGALLRELQGSGEMVRFAYVHPSGKVISSYDDTRLFSFWSVPDGQLLGTYTSDSLFGYLPESDYIVIQEVEGENYTLIFLETMETVASYPVTPGRTDNYVRISPDNQFFAETVDGINIHIRSLPDGDVLFELEGHSCEISAVNFTEDNQFVISGDVCGGVRIWSLEDGSFQGCAIDLDIVPPDVDLNQYDITLPGGGTVTYTLPCGAPIPAGAVCTCNCVGGGGCSCVGHSSGGSSGGGSHYWFPN